MSTSKKRAPQKAQQQKLNHNQLLELQGLVDGINKVQAVIEFDTSGHILHANENFLNAVGYSLDEIKGQHHKMFCDPEYTMSVDYQQFWQKLNRGEFETGEFLRFGKGGKEIWINASYNPIFDDDNNVLKIVKFATDVTAQKLQSDVYEGKVSAVEKAQASIQFDLGGNIIEANDNFLNALGYSMNEIKGKHHSMFCEPEYSAKAEYKQFWEDLAEGKFQSGEFKRIGKAGKEVWINASYNPIFDARGRVIMIVKFATDITEQVKKRKEFESYVDLLEETANSLSASSTELMTTAAQMAKAAEETNNQSNTVAATAEQVSSGVQVVSTNTAQMVESIKEIAKSANDSAEMSRATSENAENTNRTIEQLGVSSKEIGEVIKVISSIAQQTNLLALNATIEAARAGDAGKGFAVVANEVKELANQTAKATQDITNKIGAIQSDSDKAVDAIMGISQAIGKLNDISGSIAASVEEQTATTDEVSRVVDESSTGVLDITSSIKVVAEAAEQSSISSAQTVEASKGLAQLAEQLKDVVEKVKAA